MAILLVDPNAFFHIIYRYITYAYFATPTFLLSNNSAARPQATPRLTQLLKQSLKALSGQEYMLLEYARP